MLTRRIVIAGTAAGTACGVFETPTALARPISEQQEEFGTVSLHRERATVPVYLNEIGPLRFAVDTAANCSVVSSDLVESLGLEPLGELAMHTLIGREIVPAVRAARLRSGALDAPNPRLAVGKRSAMAGLDGLLGTDLLADNQLILNFQGRARTRVARSNAPPRGFLDTLAPQSRLVVAGERRFGSLLMIPVRIGSARAVAIVDSGAEGTLLNHAAAREGRAVPLPSANGQNRKRIHSPTGEATLGEGMILRSLNIAGVDISNLPVAVGDFHTFRLWGLVDEPALLIGLDVLRLFTAVYIDLKRSEFSLRF